ncbi:MAG: DUF1549 domain-containing protein [Planctomycetes bacterium]|nr:DUF1549 domain-containing protein [Planctomycetota bacterium]
MRLVCLLALFAGATVEGARSEVVSFGRDVKPILASRCFACHGPDADEAGLRLHQQATALAELDSGDRAIVPGQPAQSTLLARINSADADLRMPPEGKSLKEEEIAALRQWISEGAVFEKHWAFVPTKSHAPPEIDRSDSSSNPIDAFILAKLQERGLSHAPPADKRTLARRVYYDVTGLPPTMEQLQEFLSDDRPDAYSRLVDRLLASPHYGERWARHWLDVVRFAETNSFERDAAKPFAWKYRDYVIHSLNNDKPYDQFIVEQLAGDELDHVTAETVTATGYYRLGVWDDEPADPLQSQYDELDNILTTTTQAFLGLTIGCARCHDHKIDPIPQTDYYGLLAFFADVTPYAMPHRREAKFHSLWDWSSNAVKKRREKLTSEQEMLQAEKRRIEQQAIEKMESPLQRLTETSEREKVLEEHLYHHLTDEDERQRYEVLVKQIEETKAMRSELPEPELILSLAKCDPHPDTMRVMSRGNPHTPGESVEPHFPVLFGDTPPQIPTAAQGARSAGRRLVLAKWIASPQNRLTSRVIVNRVWQHHFGRGIVRSSNNFGQLGTWPTHPELLDWLANWLVQHDWRLKSLHRLILTSNTYRMSSQSLPEGLANDPTNDLFWRFDMRRLSAEEIRDAVLLTTGRLNDKMFGPSIYPKLSQEVLQTQSMPGQGWQTSSPGEASRRSVYIHIKRSLIPPELANFDFPDPDSSCEARFNTTQAAQALNLLHGEFLQTQAARLAERVKNEAGDDWPTQVGHVLRLVLQRNPTEKTIVESLALVDRYRNKYHLPPDEALRQFCLMVLNLNEFVYLD